MFPWVDINHFKYSEKKEKAEGEHAALIYQIFIAKSGDDTRDLKEMSLFALK
jgi:hypothetical protein